MRTFREFLGTKQRESRKQLKLVKEVLEGSGFEVEDYLENRFAEPYVYCYNPDHNTSFKGVRIYKIGDKIAYRIQRESDTHPFGSAYLLDLDGIFNDLMASGTVKKEKLGHKVMEEVVECIRSFFQESAKAEKQEDKWSDEEGMGMVSVRNPLGGDYSSMVHDGGK